MSSVSWKDSVKFVTHWSSSRLPAKAGLEIPLRFAERLTPRVSSIAPSENRNAYFGFAASLMSPLIAVVASLASAASWRLRVASGEPGVFVSRSVASASSCSPRSST